MTATPRDMARNIRTSHAAQAERERLASVAPRVRLAYRSETGQPTMRDRIEASCDHSVMATVEADLPGDRTVGWCACGKNYIDTGTWDERNRA